MHFRRTGRTLAIDDRRPPLTSVAGTFEECREALRRREVACPDCGRAMRPRGYLGPLRKLRDGTGCGWPARPRGHCDHCDRSHVLQPAAIVAHRSDSLLVLAGALLAFAGGARPAVVAAAAGIPVRTARGWLAQARAFSGAHLPAFAAMLDGLGGHAMLPRAGEDLPVPGLASVLRALAGAAEGKYGGGEIPEWERVNLICRGRFLSPSLNSRFYHDLDRAVMA